MCARFFICNQSALVCLKVFQFASVDSVILCFLVCAAYWKQCGMAEVPPNRANCNVAGKLLLTGVDWYSRSGSWSWIIADLHSCWIENHVFINGFHSFLFYYFFFFFCSCRTHRALWFGPPVITMQRSSFRWMKRVLWMPLTMHLWVHTHPKFIWEHYRCSSEEISDIANRVVLSCLQVCFQDFSTFHISWFWIVPSKKMLKNSRWPAWPFLRV